jgi:hypothetical protein
MSEPGERRRRRELERAGEGGAPDTAFGVGGDATPPSRRALRSQPVPSVGPDGQRGGAAPYQVPGLVPDTSQAMRSRRTIRDTRLDPTGARPATTGQPSVRPPSAGSPAPSAWSGHPSAPATPAAPAQTYTSRPATSRPAAGPARPAEAVGGRPGQVPTQPPAASPSAARPTVARPAVAGPAVARPSIVRPSTAAQPTSPYSAAPAPTGGPAQVNPTAQPTTPGQTTPRPTGFQPRSSAWGGQPGAGSARPAAGAAGAPSAGSVTSSRYGTSPAATPPPAPSVPSAPQAGWQPTSGRTGPSWAPSAGASAVVPTPASPPAYQAPVVGSWGAAAAAAPTPAVEVADDVTVPHWGSLGVAGSSTATRDEPVQSGSLYGDDDERPSHPYTWLQLIVLALVAFVLGFLIVLLAGRGSSGASDPVATPTPAASAPVDAGAHPVV